MTTSVVRFTLSVSIVSHRLATGASFGDIAAQAAAMPSGSKVAASRQAPTATPIVGDSANQPAMEDMDPGHDFDLSMPDFADVAPETVGGGDDDDVAENEDEALDVRYGAMARGTAVIFACVDIQSPTSRPGKLALMAVPRPATKASAKHELDESGNSYVICIRQEFANNDSSEHSVICSLCSVRGNVTR